MIYFPKEEIDLHALDKWLIRGSKHSQGNQSQSSKHPTNYPSWECQQDTRAFHKNEFNLVFSKKVRG